MTETEKEKSPISSWQLEHLATLADDRWREYDSKSQAEWKLSYAIWAALLAATGALLTRQTDFPLPHKELLLAVAIFVMASFIVHWRFLDFVHSKLGALRPEMTLILKRRTELLGIPPSGTTNVPQGRVSMIVQLSITALLGALLAGVAVVASVQC